MLQLRVTQRRLRSLNYRDYTYLKETLSLSASPCALRHSCSCSTWVATASATLVPAPLPRHCALCRSCSSSTLWATASARLALAPSPRPCALCRSYSSSGLGATASARLVPAPSPKVAARCRAFVYGFDAVPSCVVGPMQGYGIKHRTLRGLLLLRLYVRAHARFVYLTTDESPTIPLLDARISARHLPPSLLLELSLIVCGQGTRCLNKKNGNQQSTER